MGAKARYLVVLTYAFFSIFLLLTVACSAENPSATGENGDLSTATGSGGSMGISGSPAIVGSAGSNGRTIVTGSGGSGTTCANKSVATSRSTPWVLFVIDRSQTMAQSYPGSTSRWQAIYDTLMTPNTGIIAKLESTVYFGIMLYDGLGTCPHLETVAPDLNNYQKINAVYKAASPGQYTPTALALNAAYKLVPSQQQTLDVQKRGSQYVVLCTDGEPNGCPDSATGGGFPPEDFEGPAKEVTTAANNGIKTYVVSVASGGQEYQDYLEELATIGNTGSKAFSPATKDELAAQLGGIIGNAIGCQIQLSGRVVIDLACTGTVVLNSQALVCNDPNGWKLVDESHIELVGAACDKFMNDPTAMITATFPCGAVDII